MVPEAPVFKADSTTSYTHLLSDLVVHIYNVIFGFLSFACFRRVSANSIIWPSACLGFFTKVFSGLDSHAERLLHLGSASEFQASALHLRHIMFVFLAVCLSWS